MVCYATRMGLQAINQTTGKVIRPCGKVSASVAGWSYTSWLLNLVWPCPHWPNAQSLCLSMSRAMFDGSQSLRLYFSSSLVRQRRTAEESKASPETSCASISPTVSTCPWIWQEGTGCDPGTRQQLLYGTSLSLWSSKSVEIWRPVCRDGW